MQGARITARGKKLLKLHRKPGRRKNVKAVAWKGGRPESASGRVGVKQARKIEWLMKLAGNIEKE